MITMSVDPGIAGTGYAIWDKKKLINFGVINSKIKDWEKAGRYIAFRVWEQARWEGAMEVYCEFPAFHQSSVGTVTAKSGALVKLAWFVGVLDGMFTMKSVKFIPVRVIDWKGQLPKDIVNRRIRGILKSGICKKLHTHAWDAVGIGLYIHGRMK